MGLYNWSGGAMGVDTGRSTQVVKNPKIYSIGNNDIKTYGAANTVENWRGKGSTNATKNLQTGLNTIGRANAQKQASKEKKSISNAKKKAKAADLKKDRAKTKASLKQLQGAGVDSAWLSSQNYGRQMSGKEASRLLDAWNKSRIPTLPGATLSGRDISQEEADRTARANAESLAAGEAERDEYWSEYRDMESRREKAAAAMNTNYSQDRGSAEQAFDLGSIVRGLAGIPTANATTGGQVNPPAGAYEPGKKTTFGRALDIFTDPVGLIPKVNSLLGTQLTSPSDALAKALGLEGLVSKPGGLAYNLTDSPARLPGGGETVNPSDPNSVFYQEQDRPTPAPYASRDIYNQVQTKRGLPQNVIGTHSIFDNARTSTDSDISAGISNQIPQDSGMPQPSGLSAIGGTGNYDFGNGITNLGIGKISMKNPFPGLTPKDPQAFASPYQSGEVAPIGSENGTIQKLLGSGSFGVGKGSYPQGGMVSGFNSYGSPFGSDLSSIFGGKDEDTNYSDQANETLNQLRGTNESIISQGQDIINSINPQLANSDPEYKALVDQFANLTDQAKGANGEFSIATASPDYNLPNTTMANTNLASALTGDLAPAMVGQSTKIAKAKKPKKSKDPYQNMIDQQNQFYQDQVNAQNTSFAQQKADREATLQSILSGLDTQYSQTQQTGQSELDKAKQQDLLKLSGQFSFANSDPNDEQRIQYQNRLSSDYTEQLQSLIAKLAAAKGQDYNSAQTNYLNQNLSADQASQQTMAQLASSRQNSLQSIMQAKLAAQERQREFDAQMAQQQWANNMASRQFNASQANQINSQAQSQQKYQNDLLQSILARGANMQFGGREYAQKVADSLGLGNISAHTPNNWENAYRTPQKSQTMINLGGGRVLDPNTGDVYDTN